MGQLFVFPKPSKGQLATCYVRKLAELNHYISANEMYGHHFNEAYDQDNISLKQLCDLTGHNSTVMQDVMLLISDQNEQNTFLYGHLHIPSYHLTKELFVCRSCLEEQSFMEGKWRIAWLPCCTKHHKALTPFNYSAEPIYEPDKQVIDTLLQIQPALERALDNDAFNKDLNTDNSIVAKVDKQLKRSLKPDKLESLNHRNKKYSRRYFPYKRSEAFLFMECLYDQIVA